jgi:hypothetical protein
MISKYRHEKLKGFGVRRDFKVLRVAVYLINSFLMSEDLICFGSKEFP